MPPVGMTGGNGSAVAPRANDDPDRATMRDHDPRVSAPAARTDHDHASAGHASGVAGVATLRGARRFGATLPARASNSASKRSRSVTLYA